MNRSINGSIEDVIRASREAGGFRQKGYFTLASEKARTKVSTYALPDPFYYCLEFVQSAVASGARYVDVDTDEQHATVSFAGAFYKRDDLEHLFDFLIVSRHDDAFRALRRLAVGIAAALSLSDASVVLETGDGTLEGSTRFELSNINGSAVIGTPKRPIGGTFIKVTHARYSGPFEEFSREQSPLMDRCEYLPVTLVINQEMPFGFASARALQLHGYPHAISFDEGDLYGAVAVPRGRRLDNTLKLLTNGVTIAVMNLPSPFGPVAGVVTFDKLHKTAGQYEIVQDERVDELKKRLKPYVDSLCRSMGISDEMQLDELIDPPAEGTLAQDETDGEPLVSQVEVSRARPSLYGFTSLSDIVARIQECDDEEEENEAIRRCLYELLYQKGANHAFFEFAGHRIRVEDGLPEAPVATLVPGEDGTDAGAALVLNGSHPTVRQKMARCGNHPQELLCLALSVAGALKIQSLSLPHLPTFSDDEMVSMILRFF